MKYSITRHDGARFEATDLSSPQHEWGRAERREPSASRDGDPCQWRIEDVAGELVMVTAATITAVEMRTPLREARPDWYAVGVPRLEGAEVVVPADYSVEVIDTSAEDAAAAQKAAVAAIQSRLDTLAQSWDYDDIKSGADYRDDPYPRFAAEGKVMFLWRSATWAAVDQHRDAASLEELMSYLPPIPERPTP
jgi:hypothetical protein